MKMISMRGMTTRHTTDGDSPSQNAGTEEPTLRKGSRIIVTAVMFVAVQCMHEGATCVKASPCPTSMSGGPVVPMPRTHSRTDDHPYCSAVAGSPNLAIAELNDEMEAHSARLRLSLTACIPQ